MDGSRDNIYFTPGKHQRRFPEGGAQLGEMRGPGVSTGGSGNHNATKPSSDNLPRWVHSSQLLSGRTRGAEGVKPRHPDPKPQVPASPVFPNPDCTLESLGQLYLPSERF